MTTLGAVVLLVMCAFASSAYATALPDELAKDTAWAEYKTAFQKHFSDLKKEKTSYFAWKDTLTKIMEHNAEYERGESTFKMGVNQYSDLTPKEYKTYVLGLKIPSKNKICESPMCEEEPNPEVSNKSRVARSIPNSIDWRQHGYVTPVKNQGNCGSCWAFSSTGSMEGQNFKKTGKLIGLSEQNLVDCCGSRYGGHGCNGGWMTSGYSYVMANGGIDRPYYYEGRQGPCRFRRHLVAGTCRSFKKVYASEAALKRAVATVGPIAVAVDAGQPSFRSYRSGVYSDRNCRQRANHAVLVVGYGTNYYGKKYWLIKNSWGTSWGMNGYMMMARDANNMCAICTHAYYPLV